MNQASLPQMDYQDRGSSLQHTNGTNPTPRPYTPQLPKYHEPEPTRAPQRQDGLPLPQPTPSKGSRWKVGASWLLACLFACWLLMLPVRPLLEFVSRFGGGGKLELSPRSSHKRGRLLHKRSDKPSFDLRIRAKTIGDHCPLPTGWTPSPAREHPRCR